MKRTSLACVIAIAAFLAPSFLVYGTMQSTHYTIQFDTIESGGGEGTSTNYINWDAIGEQATGNSTSTHYTMRAGYEQMYGSSIAISVAGNVTLPSISGLTGGTASSSAGWNVTTDDTAGYTLTVQVSTTPALKAGTSAFADYSPSGGAPDFAFSIPTSASAFGFTPQGSDIISRYKDNGSACNTGALDTSNACWDGLSTATKLVSQSAADNQPNGATTTIIFEAQSGSAHIQDAGTYTATVTLTALPL